VLATLRTAPDSEQVRLKIVQIEESFIHNLELLNGYTQSVSKQKFFKQDFTETLDRS